MVMKKILVVAAVAAVALLAVGIYTSLPAQADNSGNSQLFTPGRYALVEGEINVATLSQPGGRNSNEQKVMFKVDTTTGQVWVLQLGIVAPNDPTVNSAVWAPVSNSGGFTPFGQGGNISPINPPQPQM